MLILAGLALIGCQPPSNLPPTETELSSPTEEQERAEVIQTRLIQRVEQAKLAEDRIIARVRSMEPSGQAEFAKGE
jgi:hypothetical protein